MYLIFKSVWNVKLNRFKYYYLLVWIIFVLKVEYCNFIFIGFYEDYLFYFLELFDVLKDCLIFYLYFFVIDNKLYI